MLNRVAHCQVLCRQRLALWQSIPLKKSEMMGSASHGLKRLSHTRSGFYFFVDLAFWLLKMLADVDSWTAGWVLVIPWPRKSRDQGLMTVGQRLPLSKLLDLIKKHGLTHRNMLLPTTDSRSPKYGGHIQTQLLRGSTKPSCPLTMSELGSACAFESRSF